MRKLMFIVAALATLGGSAVAPAEAEIIRHPIHGIVRPHPGCWGPRCIHGIILHRVCVAWEVFGGERHCVRWRNVR
jgi:hypothetical protein